ncbi:unnamed protein product [Chondrus crispus]|uniref:Uncharacterized protein n=1 Tax=Chondrus crispus TaxID=2769 RepID=R7QQP9_CHOCR|nr:unnamed protein product [Chondrus crispus]XP_005713886.1 unnamed protein product [Chondrus crispus]CDF34067.1 unnamed protein product [Chondrus crispus]CDF40058.1 unnamed protein product [Chondrus crispus]|eukprot:XP_005710352.1 unnamed protein product [Chondrus crispus]
MSVSNNQACSLSTSTVQCHTYPIYVFSTPHAHQSSII